MAGEGVVKRLCVELFIPPQTNEGEEKLVEAPALMTSSPEV